MDRAALARRLESRAAAFVDDGLLTKVEACSPRSFDVSLPAVQSIGYREFVQVARGTLAASEALRIMRRDTVRYAKRQWTWFAREPGVEWLDVEKLGGPDGWPMRSPRDWTREESSGEARRQRQPERAAGRPSSAPSTPAPARLGRPRNRSTSWRDWWRRPPVPTCDVGAEWQNRRHVDPNWYVGKGKVGGDRPGQRETGFHPVRRRR